MVRDTLPPARRNHIETALLRPAAETIIGPSFGNLPNIQCWKNSAVGCVGYALQDQALVSIALDNPIRGFRTLMSRNVVEGGLWIEGSLGYQHYALSALWPLAEAARRNGTDLYASQNYGSLFDGPLGLALPSHEIAWEQDAVKILWKARAGVYPGVELRRELMLKDDRITDRFICESESEHLYDWAFHSAGALTVSIVTAARQDAIGHDNGYQHIKASREGATEKDWSAGWVQGSTALTLHIKGEPGTVVITGAGPGRNPADSTPLLM